MNRILRLIIGVGCISVCSCHAKPSSISADLECRALRGDLDALRDVVRNYIDEDPDSTEAAFWCARLGENGSDEDRLRVVDILIGDSVDYCRTARELLARVKDREVHMREIDEKEKRIALWDRANAEAERARIAFFRETLGASSEPRKGTPVK